jgi:hypothetical protein
VKNPDVYFVGCPFHMAYRYNAARKGWGSFSGASASSGFNVTCWEFSCRSKFLYYWFDKGTKRKNELNKFCVFCDKVFNSFEACILTYV